MCGCVSVCACVCVSGVCGRCVYECLSIPCVCVYILCVYKCSCPSVVCVCVCVCVCSVWSVCERAVSGCGWGGVCVCVSLCGGVCVSVSLAPGAQTPVERRRPSLWECVGDTHTHTHTHTHTV